MDETHQLKLLFVLRSPNRGHSLQTLTNASKKKHMQTFLVFCPPVTLNNHFSWVLGETTVFYAQVWFIIQLKQPIRNGCLGYQPLSKFHPERFNIPTWRRSTNKPTFFLSCVYHKISVWYVYLLTYPKNSTIHGGKYTVHPMDPSCFSGNGT